MSGHNLTAALFGCAFTLAKQAAARGSIQCTELPTKPHRPAIPPGLVRALREGRCMLFVGAGFSRNAGNPDFVGLLKSLCLQVNPHAEKNLPPGATYTASNLRALAVDDKALNKVLEEEGNAGLDEVQFDLYRVLGYQAACQTMHDVFVSSCIVNDIYDRQRKALLKLNFQAAATWNFDNLLDGKLTSVPLKADFTEEHFWSDVAAGAVAGGPSRRLVKLNGSLSASEGDDLRAILGREDYHRLEDSRKHFHQQAAQRYSILTVGLRMESEATPYNPLGGRWGGYGWASNSSSSNEHYIILPVREGDDSSSEYRRILELERVYSAQVITFTLIDARGKLRPESLAELLESIQEQVTTSTGQC